MRHLHLSPIHLHGYLTSRNCLIDGRWVLKITGFGMLKFHGLQGIRWRPKKLRDLLWFAPEILRNEELLCLGTQAGDVYSFGIIATEILTKRPPFVELEESEETIINRLRMGEGPLIRPRISQKNLPPEVAALVQRCMSERPELRPNFGEINDVMKKFSGGK